MDLKMNRLNQGEKLAAGSAVALLVCMFFGWFSFGPFVTNAWDSLHYISPLLTIASAATLAIVTLKALGKDLDIPDGSILFILGCVAALLILFRLIDPVSAGEASPFGGSGEAEVGGSLEAGLFLGLCAALGIAVGGYMATGGQAVEQLKGLLASRGGPAVSQQPPPPPPPPNSAPAQGPPPPPITAPPGSPPVQDPPLPPVTAPPARPEPASPAQAPPAASPPAATEERSVFCEHCGAHLRESDRFCGECGRAAASS